MPYRAGARQPARRVQHPDVNPPVELAVKFKKTRFCRFFPRCIKGDACGFAHSNEELRVAPNFTKTRMCAGWHNGRCKLDPRVCMFAHGPADLRSAEIIMELNLTESSNFNRQSSDASSSSISRALPDATPGHLSLNPIVAAWLERIKISAGPDVGMLSKEDCEAVLIKSMPDCYED
mmetsp:Transcript_32338/g.81701  ORF Transcript_32338/g.81701 Transcript_32338/m.81701 type:complete len:177 (-) Transcript_32338:8-538(-)